MKTIACFSHSRHLQNVQIVQIKDKVPPKSFQKTPDQQFRKLFFNMINKKVRKLDLSQHFVFQIFHDTVIAISTNSTFKIQPNRKLDDTELWEDHVTELQMHRHILSQHSFIIQQVKPWLLYYFSVVCLPPQVE